jgi:glucose uptake protein GlcU
MKAIKPPLLLYMISGFLFFLSTIINNEYLTLVSKPVISTSIFFHYFHESRGKVNFWFSLVLFLLFVSGIFNLFEDEFALQYVILINLVVYCILLGFVIRSLFEINLKSLDNVNLTYIILMLLFLSCLLYVCLFLVFDSTSVLYLYIIVYGSILLILGFLNTVLYDFKNSKEVVSLMMATFCFIICDLFYVIYYYYYDFIFFRYISVLCNIISFYFLVNYFLLRDENK